MFQFGIGGMYARPVGGNQSTPSGPQRFGTIQDVSVEFNQKLVELRGQFKAPDDVAPSDMDLKGKGAFGRIEIDIYNRLYFADSITTGIKRVVGNQSGGQGEAGVVGAGPDTYVVAHGATFAVDLGVFDANGNQLQSVASSPVAGTSYTVDATTGTYTFASGDAGKTYYFNYVWNDTTSGRTLTATNHIQGYGPIFELWLLQPYQGDNGLHLFQCRSSKMSAPMKRDGYMISDFEFEAYPNAAGQWFEWFQISA